MKKLITTTLVLILCFTEAWSQRVINETYNMKTFNSLDLYFEYPQLVRIKVWDKNEVKVEGNVSIHSGEYDEDFELYTKKSGDSFKIGSRLHNLEKHRNHAMIFHDQDEDGNSRTIVKSDKGVSVTTGSSSNSKKGKSYHNGIEIDIEITLTVPARMEVELIARYGLVEVMGNPSFLNVEARYGGVDVMVNESESLELDATTQWGQIFSNLKVPVEMGGDDMTGQWMKARVALKKGENRLSIESQYGNVYLRKN